MIALSVGSVKVALIDLMFALGIVWAALFVVFLVLAALKKVSWWWLGILSIPLVAIFFFMAIFLVLALRNPPKIDPSKTRLYVPKMGGFKVDPKMYDFTSRLRKLK